jgi:Sec-independent protein translocase protein TatA
VTTTAFLGVGAPEAVLVGVVALIVFGPKGLAEVRSSPSDCGELSTFYRTGQKMHLRWGSVVVRMLTQAVKGLGSTLKAFQPTIREIVSVSSDLKNSLEEQIGLDDIRSELRNSVTPEPRPVPPAQQARPLSLLFSASH